MDTHPHHIAAALHFAGFLCGLALYGMLLGLALRRGQEGVVPPGTRGVWQRLVGSADPLPVLTGVLGVIWNAGALVVHGTADLGLAAPPAFLAAAAYASLGFLPAVAAHSIVRPGVPVPAGRLGRALVTIAYALSGCAAVLQVHAAVVGGALPSAMAFRLLTAGYVLLTVPLIIAVRRQSLWRRALVVLALGVFAVSAIHLVDHQDFTSPLWTQVLGHHAALPLAVAILLQDYPFAFGDILLKHMLGLGSLVVVAMGGLYALVRSPLFANVGADLDRPVLVVAHLSLVVGVALVYPFIRTRIAAFVDQVVLGRADPDAVLAGITRLSAEHEDCDALVADAGGRLTSALSAPATRWDFVASAPAANTSAEAGLAVDVWIASGRLRPVILDRDGRSARIVIPTSDAPHPVALIGPLAGGRRFLAADVTLLKDAGQVLARRIDAIRIERERFDRQWREQEMARLAVDAELRALRAQINPHFLFNALTTIGYLVKAAPEQALHTLLRLTELLRRALRPDEDVVTLAGEIQLVEAYLDIERARFEERLRVEIDVPDDVKHIKIPSFVLQPLVENAVKHGIAPSRTGGRVSVSARLALPSDGTPPMAALVLTVSDTGSGRSGTVSDHEGQGIGMASVRRRLELAYGPAASLCFAVDPEAGARAVVVIPCPDIRGAGQGVGHGSGGTGPAEGHSS